MPSMDRTPRLPEPHFYRIHHQFNRIVLAEPGVANGMPALLKKYSSRHDASELLPSFAERAYPQEHFAEELAVRILSDPALAAMNKLHATFRRIGHAYGEILGNANDRRFAQRLRAGVEHLDEMKEVTLHLKTKDGTAQELSLPNHKIKGSKLSLASQLFMIGAASEGISDRDGNDNKLIIDTVGLDISLVMSMRETYRHIAKELIGQGIERHEAVEMLEASGMDIGNGVLEQLLRDCAPQRGSSK